MLEKLARIQAKFSPFITIVDGKEGSGSRGPLFGLPISVKDNICTRGILTTAGSKILSGYVPPFDATCISKIKEAGGAVIGKTAMDEFGFGTFSTNTVYSVPKNPSDPQRSCGGSSGGAGCITAAADFPQVAIAESTGGSITAPAAFTGTVGLTPTYGRVSRYGLIDYSNSMDKIGVISRCVYDSAFMLEMISGWDPLDSTSSKTKKEHFTEFLGKDVKGMRIGVPKEYFSEGVDERVSKSVRARIEKLESLGATCKDISLPSTKYAVAAYYIIALSEASTNLAKYCGLRYGLQEGIEGTYSEYFSKVREAGFGDEAKRRIILGTYARMAGFRDEYYLKALRIRTMIIKEFKKVFSEFDVLVAPSMPIIAPRFSEIEKLTPMQAYSLDVLTVAPNMAGMPALSVPCGKIAGLPVGLQIVSDHFNESCLFKVGSAVEMVNGW